MRIIYLSAAWVLGIWLGYRFNLPPALAALGLLPLAALFFVPARRQTLILASLSLFLLVGGALYSYAALNVTGENQARFYNDIGPLEVKAMVAEDPDIRDKSIRLVVSISEIRLEDGWRQAEGKALVTVPRFPGFRYGDVLLLKGELETPVSLEDFDYRGYLENKGIYSTMFFPAAETLAAGRGSWFFTQIYNLRGRLALALAETLPEPQAALAQGIVLGVRSNIPAGLNDAFSRSGAAHLLAISGINITFMAGILLGIGTWIFGRRRNLHIWLALGVIWIYAVLTGLNPPVVRGAVMASLFLTAEGLGRQRSGLVTLCLAAAVMTAAHPYVLGDVSFQLSFLAMAGLIFVYPPLRTAGRNIIAARLGDTGWLAGTAGALVDTLSASLAATLAVWPVIAYYFGFVSLAGPLATFLAAPAILFIIITGGLTAVFGLVNVAIGQVFGWAAWPFLSYLILVVQWLAAPSISAVDVAALSPAFIWAYYAVAAALLWIVIRRTRAKSAAAGTSGRMRTGSAMSLGMRGGARWAVLPLGLLALLAVLAAATVPDGDLRVSFLDIGQGDAILISRGSRQVLVDGGPSPREITLALGRQMPFWNRTIDMVVLTHPHADHLAGLVETLRRYRVGQVIQAPAAGYSAPLYEEWSRLLAEKHVKNTIARAGLLIDLGGGMVIEVINPPVKPDIGTASDIDNNSLALRLAAGRFSFLLVSDIMEEGERELVLGRAALKSTVLKVGHHGSDTASSAGFLAVVDPRVAVISVGAGNTFGHPAPAALQRLGERVGNENIFRTDIDGTLVFVTDGETLRLLRED